ncbi:MAG: T9SS type A sorting domain-containing protein [Paludibacteraceae bacterium]|nr:T9SS type A sorting domain-containing protein [Paludibacteraceae bacterium]
MKKILLGLMMLTTAATMSAQLALRQEHYFDGRMSLCNKLYVVGLDDMYLIRGNDSLFHIYDSDYSLVHTFPQEPQIVAKNVFTEDGKICVVNVTNENDLWNTYRIEILKEDGECIQGWGFENQHPIVSLIKIADTYKFVIELPHETYIYSCPGNGEATTSVENVPAKVKRNAYPNPANELVTLPYEANGATSMKIYDMQGKLVERKFLDKNKQELQLNVKDYPSGMYFFEVNGESNSFVVE